MRKLITLFLSVLFFTTFQGLKSQDIETLWDIKVQVASSEEENIFNAPSSVSIIDKEMIQDYNFTSVSEAIQTISGMAVIRTYLKRNLPTSRGILQDHYANKVLVLVNGIPSWNAVTGEGNLDRIDINDVERIEVLKGPASVLYGTNAYSGAINIVLKSSEEQQLNSHMGFGTNGSYQAGANFAATKGDFTYFVSGNSSSIIQKETQFKDDAGYEGLLREYIGSDNFTMQAGYKAHSLLFNGTHGNESFLGVTPKFTSGAGNPHILKAYLLNYTFDQDLSDKFNLRFGGNYDYGMRNLSRSRDDVTRANIEGYRINGFARAGYQISEAFHFEAGLTYDQRKSVEYKNYNAIKDTLMPVKWESPVDPSKTVVLDGNNGMNDQQVSEFSAFGQLKFVKNKFRALLGSRYTNNELFGDNISSRITFSYAFNERNSVKLIYGESFRSPALFEQYFTYTTVLGNTELEPEKSKSAELAYLTGTGNFFMQALVYYGIYENKVVRQKGDAVIFDGTFPVSNISIYQNGNEFTATGVEIELKYNNPKIISTFLNFNYVAGDDGDKDESDNYNFKYVPEMSLAFGLGKNFGERYGISAVVNYWSETTGPVKDANNNFTAIDPMMVADLNLFYKHELGGAKLRHSLSIKNLTDADVLYPEYVSRTKLNEVSSGYYQTILYTISVSLY
ncbi:MAG: TonB-dependent receptor [Bacteroidales bacterium]|nr:TonB-dependent receptor [Bacteroidales bacterium]